MELELELCGQRLLTATQQPRPTAKTQLLLGEPSKHAEAWSLEPPSWASTSFCARGQTTSEKGSSARLSSCWRRTGLSHLTALGPSGWGRGVGGCWENLVRGKSRSVIERTLGNRRVRDRWMSTSENRTLRESQSSKGCWEYPVPPIPEGGQRGRPVESRPAARQGRAGEDVRSTPSSTPGPERTQDRPRGELRVTPGGPVAWRQVPAGLAGPSPWPLPTPDTGYEHLPLLCGMNKRRASCQLSPS